MPSNYVSLKRLIDDWARDSGELQAVILKNVCDHEAAGHFPPGTFRHPVTGEWGGAGSLSELVRQMREGQYDEIREEAAHTLQRVAVSRAGLLQFCKITNVRPPRSVAGLWKSLKWRTPCIDFPPPYPSTPEEIAYEAKRRVAAEREQRDAEAESVANGGLANLAEKLQRVGEWMADGKEIDWNFWGEQRNKSRDFTESYIRQISDVKTTQSLRNRLRQLVLKFSDLRTRADEAAGVGPTEKNISREEIGGEGESRVDSGRQSETVTTAPREGAKSTGAHYDQGDSVPDETDRGSVPHSHATKAKLRAALTEWLELRAKDVGARWTKKQYLQAARQKLDSFITDNLFAETWRAADLPDALREPGVRPTRRETE